MNAPKGGLAMTMLETRYEHIVLDDGVPYIAGTTMKVVELAVAHTIWNWDSAELRKQYPHLSPGQIHSALAFYWDHQQEIDADIAHWEAVENEIEQRLPVYQGE